jgi:hypothetical protein
LVAKRKKAFGKTFIIQNRRLGGQGEKTEKRDENGHKKEVIQKI